MPQPVKEYVKPARQLHLSEDELAEETVCNLSAVNPLAPSNITRYIPRERVFKCALNPAGCFWVQLHGKLQTCDRLPTAEDMAVLA